MRLRLQKIILLFGAVGCLTANAQKIAHLNLDSLIRMMPETKVVTEAAESYLNGLKQELDVMQKEFQNKYSDYTANEAMMSDLVKKSKQEDLQQLQNRIQDFQAQAEQDFQRKQIEINTPLYEKAKKGIAAVAKENGYRYVLDTSNGRTSVLYNETSDDILAMVKKKLDAMPLITIPGTKAQEEAPAKTPSPGGNKPPATKGK